MNPTGGRPSFPEEQYQTWLEDMRPFLRAGNSLYFSMEKSSLVQHKDAIYEKYRLNDWFAEKVDAYRATIGELANNIVFKVLDRVSVRMVETEGKSELTREELEVVKLVAEKHRAAQPFFVTRTETAVADPNKIGKVLDRLESDYGQLGIEASKQVVANDPPIQNQDQNGQPSDVQP